MSAADLATFARQATFFVPTKVSTNLVPCFVQTKIYDLNINPISVNVNAYNVTILSLVLLVSPIDNRLDVSSFSSLL